MPPAHNVQAPARLRHLVSHRIARLGAEEETLLTVAAAIGEEWDLRVVEAVLGWEEEPLLRALEAALRAGVIGPTGEGERYRFRHSLMREVLYGDQLARRRTRLHQRIASALEQTPESARPGRAAALAYHFAAAEAWEQAARYGIAAGGAARDRFAGHGALLAYHQALDALDRAPPGIDRELRVGLHERLGQAHLVLGQPDAAETAFLLMRETARAAGDRLGEGRALVWISYVRRRQYRAAESEAAGQTALRVAEELGEPRLLALANWNLGHLHEIGGALEQAARHAAEGERSARAAGAADVLSRSLQVQAIVAIWQSRYRDGERLAGEALDLARAGHDGLALAAAHWRQGVALGELGHYEAALHTLLDGVTLAESLGERYYLAKLLNTVGWLYHELGDAETARGWDLRALEAVRGTHVDRVTEAERYTILNLASDELAAGRVDAAAEHLCAFAPLLARREYGLARYLNRYQLLLAEVALAQGDAAAALRAAQAVPRLAPARDMPKNVAKSKLLTGRAYLTLGRPAAATEAMAEGVALADRIGHGSLRWQGRLWLGDALRALRRDASDVYREAMAQVMARANGLDDERLRDTFLASSYVHGAARPGRPARGRTTCGGAAGRSHRARARRAAAPGPASDGQGDRRRALPQLAHYRVACRQYPHQARRRQPARRRCCRR